MNQPDGLARSAKNPRTDAQNPCGDVLLLGMSLAGVVLGRDG